MRTRFRGVASALLAAAVGAGALAAGASASSGVLFEQPGATDSVQTKTAWLAGEPGGGIRLSPAAISRPTNLVAVDEFNSRDVLLTWAASAGTPLESLIERQRFDNGVWAAFGRLRLLGPAATMTDNPGPGRYRYRVATVGTTGRSEYSDWASLTVVAVPVGVEMGRYPRSTERPLGMNLEGISYYSRSLAFNNLMRTSGQWLTQYAEYLPGGPNPWDTGAYAAMAKDENNYPLMVPFAVAGDSRPQKVSTLILRDLEGRHPVGRYTLLYEGTGQITVTLEGRLFSSAPGRVLFDVGTGTGGVQITIAQSLAGDHVRNIRIYAPGIDAASGPFNAKFINKVKPYAVLRFMDWQQTNNSLQQSWSGRPVQSKLFDAPALEDIADLCNLVHADPWVCVPHLADDDYVRGMAQVLRGRLEPERTVYVERSNEVWNGQFQQAAHAQARGIALGLPGSNFDRQVRFHAKDSARIFRIFEQEFGGTTRLKRVLASQAANTGVSNMALAWLRDQEPDTRADVLAIAPYFGGGRGSPSNATATIALGLEGLIAALDGDVDVATAWTNSQKPIASAFGVELIGYEGGQHLLGYNGAENNLELTNLLIAVNRDPRMYAIVRRYHEAWWRAGGGMMCPYILTGRPTKWGSWGYFEFIDDTTTISHKARGVLDASAFGPQ